MPSDVAGPAAVADAAAAGFPFDVVELPTSHLGVQLRPAPLVGVLDGLTPR